MNLASSVCEGTAIKTPLGQNIDLSQEIESVWRPPGLDRPKSDTCQSENQNVIPQRFDKGLEQQCQNKVTLASVCPHNVSDSFVGAGRHVDSGQRGLTSSNQNSHAHTHTHLTTSHELP